MTNYQRVLITRDCGWCVLKEPHVHVFKDDELTDFVEPAKRKYLIKEGS